MTTTAPPVYELTVYDEADANHIATVVATLLSQNLENFPDRIAIARKLTRPVSIISTATDSACTVVFGEHAAAVYNGILGRPNVILIGVDDHLNDISPLPMKTGGLAPIGFLRAPGRRALKSILSRKLVVKGLLTHTVSTLRTFALLTGVK
ncbi:hypothetical protein [Rhodococcus pyridinivorans]|uniref:hypothetical protein n=1 Tax=Rhodococcus pyridinivorans TaxID=103816 RepID=UPI0022837FA1|nr:hypothetical protein [Rhodococcus pyridinivorans]WAL49613.1 hypothetical protein OQN32_27810 [Rhodococcus pyridinivorans]